MAKKSKKYSPAYVSSSAFQDFIRKVRNQRIDVNEISPKILEEEHGYSQYLAYALAASAKSLGLADEDGVPTARLESMKSATNEDELTDVLREIAKDAYGDLISEVDLRTADVYVIESYFRHKGVKPSTVTKAARFFVWLKELVGLEAADEDDSSKTEKDDFLVPQFRPNASIQYKETFLKVLLNNLEQGSEMLNPQLIVYIQNLIRDVEAHESKQRRHVQSPEAKLNRKEAEDDT